MKCSKVVNFAYKEKGSQLAHYNIMTGWKFIHKIILHIHIEYLQNGRFELIKHAIRVSKWKKKQKR